MTDVEGRRYLDLGSGIAVTNVGHRHPHVVAAIHAQVDALLHTSVVLQHQPVHRAGRGASAGSCPFLDDPQVFLCNSGAEAVDGAIKLARRTTGPARASSPSGAPSTAARWAPRRSPPPRPRYQEGYEPLLPVASHDRALRRRPTLATALDELDRAARHRRPPGDGRRHDRRAGARRGRLRRAAGRVAARPARALRRPRHPARVRRGADAASVAPAARSRPRPSASRPTSCSSPRASRRACRSAASWRRRALMDRWPNGTHGSTFGGNPVACAAALATIEVLEDEGLYDRARDARRAGHRAPAAASSPATGGRRGARRRR